MAGNNVSFTKGFAYSNAIAFQTEQVVTATLAAPLPACSGTLQLTTLHLATVAATVPPVAAQFQLSRVLKEAQLAVVLSPASAAFALTTLHPATLAATLAPPTAHFAAQYIVNAQLLVPLPAVTASLTAAWDVNVWRGLVVPSEAAVRQGQILAERPVQLGLRSAAPLDMPQYLRLLTTSSENRNERLALNPAQPQDDARRLTLRPGQAAPAAFQPIALNSRRPADRRHLEGVRQGRPALGSTRVYLLQYRPQNLGWRVLLHPGRPLSRTVQAPAGARQGIQRSWKIPIQPGRVKSWFSWLIAPAPLPPPVDIRLNAIDFLYPFVQINDLEFVRVLLTRWIRVRKVYFMLHTIAVTRVEGNLPLDVGSLRIATDLDSYGFILNAAVLGSASYHRLMELAYPEIDVSINGYRWRFIVTDLTYDKAFGKNSYTLVGHSKSVLLDEPFSLSQSKAFAQAYTAEQLADSELSGTSFSLNWIAPDWLVPAQTWAYANLPPIKAIGEIVAATGGFLATDRAADVLYVRPRWKALPWDWGRTINDVILPTAATTTLSRELIRGANYNRVFVSGTTATGILGDVSRAGSAGDLVMPDVISHALITHPDAARALGSSTLVNHLDKQVMKLSAPLSDEIALMAVGQLVKVVESPAEYWQGTVTDFELSVSLEQRSVKIRQTLTLERFA